MISSDCPSAAQMEGYRTCLDPQYRERFDEWAPKFRLEQGDPGMRTTRRSSTGPKPSPQEGRAGPGIAIGGSERSGPVGVWERSSTGTIPQLNLLRPVGIIPGRWSSRAMVVRVRATCGPRVRFLPLQASMYRPSRLKFCIRGFARRQGRQLHRSGRAILRQRGNLSSKVAWAQGGDDELDSR